MEEEILCVPSVDFYGERPDWLPHACVIKSGKAHHAGDTASIESKRNIRTNVLRAKPIEAVLSNCGEMTSFKYDIYNIRFRTSSKLNRYTEIKEWDKGYIVVMADYDGIGIIEEYIDLVPILKNLYLNPDTFLKDIQTVKIGNYDT